MRHFFKIHFFAACALVGAIFSAGILASCTLLIIPSGVTVERTVAASNFDTLEVDSALSATVVQGLAYSVSVRADSKLIDYIEVYTNGATLVARVRPGIGFSNSSNVQIKITMPIVRSVTVSGASTVHLAGFSVETLSADVSGASSLYASDGGSSCHNAAIDVSGASTVYLHASDTITGFISGASTVHNTGLTPNVTALLISGASSFFIW